MDDYISRQALLRDIEKYHLSDGMFQHWVEVQPSVDEWTIITEYCRKRDLVLITMESFRILQAYYNRQNGMDGEQYERSD